MTDEPIVSETTQAAERASRKMRLGFIFFIIAIILVLAVFTYGYVALFNINMGLAKTITDLKTQVMNQQQSVASLQQSIDKVQEAQQKNQDLSAQQEKMIADWQAAQQGNLEKWRVAEAQYLVKLANDQLQFAHDTAFALILLQRADEVLKSSQSASILEIRKSLASNIAALQALPQVDVSALYLRLVALDSELVQLPFPVNPLKEEKPNLSTTIPADLPWWKKGLLHSLQTLKQIVIIRRTESTALPLVLPDEKLFLLQNLHSTIQSAMWGVLNRHSDVYLASLNQAYGWIQHYFVQDAPMTKSVLENIDALRKINLNVAQIDLAPTLQLFDQYFKAP